MSIEKAPLGESHNGIQFGFLNAFFFLKIFFDVDHF